MLRVSEIYAVENQKRKIRKRIYKEIYNTLSKKIRHSVGLGHRNVILHVPSFVYGQPVFDRTRAMSYIKRQFENGGFIVNVVSDDALHVSWCKEEKSFLREKTEPEADESPFASLINLKKTANKYK
jgi:hypothetical protein